MSIMHTFCIHESSFQGDILESHLKKYSHKPVEFQNGIDILILSFKLKSMENYINGIIISNNKIYIMENIL